MDTRHLSRTEARSSKDMSGYKEAQQTDIPNAASPTQATLDRGVHPVWERFKVYHKCHGTRLNISLPGTTVFFSIGAGAIVRYPD